MKLHIAPRGSGKTYSCFTVANEQTAVVLMPDTQDVREYISKARCKEQGIMRQIPTVGLDDSLAGVKKLVIDEVEYVLKDLLKKYLHFSGEIVYATLDSTNLSLEFEP